MTHFLVGLDAGTSNIAVAVARASNETDLAIVGVGTAQSRGIFRGQVLNPPGATEAIRQAVSEAARVAGIEIETVYLGLTGSHIASHRCRGSEVVETSDRVISNGMVRRATDRALRLAPAAQGREILHALPMGFVVDGQDGIADPVGLTTLAPLEADLHLVTGNIAIREALTACVADAGLSVLSSIVGTLAAGEVALTSDEKELGVALVDVGGGSTHVAIFERGKLQSVCDVAVGGRHFTNDVALAACTSVPHAEHLKRRVGSVLPDHIDVGETVSVYRTGSVRPRVVIPRVELACILRQRAEELFKRVHASIVTSGCEPAGIVLTGGAALLTGMSDVAARILELPVRSLDCTEGKPDASGDTDCNFVTAVGLVRYAHLHLSSASGRVGAVLKV